MILYRAPVCFLTLQMIILVFFVAIIFLKLIYNIFKIVLLSCVWSPSWSEVEPCACSHSKGIYVGLFGSAGSSGYPTLRIEKNDLKSVTLMEAKAKVKDIAISRERITLKDVLQEGIYSTQTLHSYNMV